MSDTLVQNRPTLQTARLVLRRPELGDKASIIEAAGDWEVARGLSRVPHPYSAADADFFLKEIVPSEWVWAIVPKASGTFAGVIGITPGTDEEEVELGYWLGRSHWGQGFATEAAQAVVQFGFEALSLASISAGPFAQNPSSQRVLEKLGFEVVREATRQCLSAGTVVPSVEMVLTKEAWTNRGTCG